MKQEKFKVLQFIRELIVVIDKELDNYPKSEIEIKNRIRNNTYDLLEMVYEANVIEDKVYKSQLLFKSIAKIRIIDFLVNLSYDKKLISEKKYYKIGLKCGDIVKYLNGWTKSINS